jgi:hypothetical protein
VYIYIYIYIYISALKLWSNVVFGKREGDLGTSVECAPTGTAAFNIKGDTWQSVFGHSVERGNISTIEGVKNGQSLRTKLNGVKIIIFDEVSMIGCRALWEIHLRLQVASDDEAVLTELLKCEEESTQKKTPPRWRLVGIFGTEI